MKNYYPSYYPSYVTSPSHKIFVKSYKSPIHTLNGYCAKLASNLDAKVGLLTLSDPRQHKTMCFLNFHKFDVTVPLNHAIASEI